MAMARITKAKAQQRLHIDANHDQCSQKAMNRFYHDHHIMTPSPLKAKTSVLAGLKSDSWASVRFRSGCNLDSSRWSSEESRAWFKFSLS